MVRIINWDRRVCKGLPSICCCQKSSGVNKFLMAIETDANVCGKSNLYVVRETKNWYLKHKKRLKINELIKIINYMFKCIIFSIFKTDNFNFQQNIWFFIILILMAKGICLGARAGKAVALPIQNEFLRYFKNNTLILFKTAIFWFKINISTFNINLYT